VGGFAIEYRRVGNGGGWPATFEDVAAPSIPSASQPRVDLSKVVAVGHSAAGNSHCGPLVARPSANAPGAAPHVVLAARCRRPEYWIWSMLWRSK